MAARHIPAIPEDSIDLNAAIQATEQEILSDAMGDDPMDNDGDTSLEEMDEYPDGEDTQEGDAEAERQAAAEDGEGEEQGQGDEGEGERTDERQEPQQARQDDRGRREPAVPPHRLREATERAQRAEQERDHLSRARETERAEIASLHERLDNLMAQLASRGAPQPGTQQSGQQPQPSADPRPDMFADPDGYQRWVDRQIESKARDIAASTVNQTFEQHQIARVNVALDAAARGSRAFEFQPAYQALTSLNPRDPANQRLVRGIFNSPDPAQALWDWWDANGGEDYRAQIYDQLAQRFNQQQPPRSGRRMSHTDNPPPQNGGRPRNEFRGPVSARTGPPSLNGMAGGNPQRGYDPRGMDGSDRSTFDYAFDDRG